LPARLAREAPIYSTKPQPGKKRICVSRRAENLVAKWVLHFRSGRKLADINVACVRRERAGNETFLSGNRNRIRNIALPAFRFSSVGRPCPNIMLTGRTEAWARSGRGGLVFGRGLFAALTSRPGFLLRMRHRFAQPPKKITDRIRVNDVSRRKSEDRQRNNEFGYPPTHARRYISTRRAKVFRILFYPANGRNSSRTILPSLTVYTPTSDNCIRFFELL